MAVSEKDDRSDYPCRKCGRPLQLSVTKGKEIRVLGMEASGVRLIWGCPTDGIVVDARSLLAIKNERGMKIL